MPVAIAVIVQVNPYRAPRAAPSSWLSARLPFILILTVEFVIHWRLIRSIVLSPELLPADMAQAYEACPRKVSG